TTGGWRGECWRATRANPAVRRGHEATIRRHGVLHLCFGAVCSVASVIFNHHIAARILNGERHRVRLPKCHPKLDNTEDEPQQEREDDRCFDGCRPFIPLTFRPSSSHYDFR